MNFNRKAYNYGVSLVKHLLHISPEKPKILSYLITNQCNSHCITCSVWKDKNETTISSEKLENSLKSELFSEIEHVGISGGEPSLFNGLTEHVTIILNSFSHLKSLSITTNCINADYWINNLQTIFNLCCERQVYFQMNYSMDGIGQLHDRIRGTKGNFEQLEKVIKYTLHIKIPFQLHCTINKYNVYHVNRVLSYARDNKADIIFRLASPISRLDNGRQLDKIALSTKEKSFFCDFLRSDLLHASTKSPGRKLFYLKLADQLLGNGERIAPCYFKQEGVVLESNGNLSYCSRFDKPFSSIDEESAAKFKDKALFLNCEKGECRYCYHDQTGLWPLIDVLGLRLSPYVNIIKKVIYVLTKLPCVLKRSGGNKNKTVQNVAIIGMYGGGHVGDAAILGGVILRIVDRYPSIKNIIIYSIRKDRTESWLEGIKRLPREITIDVVSSEGLFLKTLKNVDVILWAGGPMMEIPVLITKHLSFVKEARRAGANFEIEGIGYGPINSWYGKWVASKLLGSASYVSVRSEKDATRIKSLGFDVDKVLKDPAFDYLNSLDGRELEISEESKRTIDKVTEGGPVIGLNLRPLWNRYGDNGEFKYDVFLEKIVATIIELSSKGYKVVFFPMNADQFGFSDLLMGYEIEKRLPIDCNYEIWETEPSIEELVYFINRLKASICMRFHAVIYSLSQKKFTIGIDYSLEGKGKVSTLLNEEDCFNMTNYSTEIVTKRMVELIG